MTRKNIKEGSDLLFESKRRRSDRLSARNFQLCIRSAEPPWEHRYENWTKKTDLWFNGSDTKSDVSYLQTLLKSHNEKRRMTFGVGRHTM